MSDELSIEPQLVLQGINLWDIVAILKRISEEHYRLAFTANGDMYFGSGGGVTETIIRRGATGGREIFAAQAEVVPLSLQLNEGQAANAFEVLGNESATPLYHIHESGLPVLDPRTFASLPTGEEGMQAWVNDSSTATWGDVVTGGGSEKVLAVFNGSDWTVAGK